MEELIKILFVFFIFTLFIFGGYKIFSHFRYKAEITIGVIIFEYICLLGLFFSFFLFLIGHTLKGTHDYYEAIDPIDSQYTPFATKHIVTLFVFLTLSIISLVSIWLRGKRLPPLTLVLAIIFVSIGIVISVMVFLQVSQVSDDDRYVYDDESFLYYFAPISYIIISLILIVKLVRQEVDDSIGRTYKNKTLNKLNNLMSKTNLQPLWVVVLLVPVFCIVTLVLVIFGQEPDSIAKVFTETTTYRFSQMQHPPYLDHTGHYLCTVAVCGHQSVVKPLRYGTRHSGTIVVNRQLLVANAFEERIAELFPSFHRFIRRNYDKYGYPVSKHITTPLRSDIVYILTKPFEYLFVIVLYLSDMNPEKRIANQYKLKECFNQQSQEQSVCKTPNEIE